MKRLVPALAAIAFLLAACADRGAVPLGPIADGGPSPSPTTSPTGSEPPTEPSPDGETRMFTYEVWFVSSDGELFVTHRTEPFQPAVGRIALTTLLEGPSEAEIAAGVQTAVPPATQLLDLNIRDGVATVDLSGAFDGGGGSLEETLRVAQVVYTITQFQTVRGMDLRLDGEPVEVFGGHGIILDRPQTRRHWDQLLPAILVESPTIGDRVQSPVTVSGTANVFEATVSLRVLDADGDEIARTFTTATCGSGCRGDYSASVRYRVNREQRGVIEVFEASAEDGRPINVVRIPVTLTP